MNFDSNGTITNGKWNLSLSLIVRLSCQFNRVTFINVYWIILNDRLSFWLFDFFLDPYHMTKCTLQGRVWLPNFGTMCWVIGCIQCHMTHGKVLYTCAMCITWYCTIHHIVRFLTGLGLIKEIELFSDWSKKQDLISRILEYCNTIG